MSLPEGILLVQIAGVAVICTTFIVLLGIAVYVETTLDKRRNK